MAVGIEMTAQDAAGWLMLIFACLLFDATGHFVWRFHRSG
jgi:hypothetical protein